MAKAGGSHWLDWPASSCRITVCPIASKRGHVGVAMYSTQTGNSFVALEIRVAVASGTAWAGHFPVRTAGHVLLLCAVYPAAVLVERLGALDHVRGLHEPRPPSTRGRAPAAARTLLS